jgi:signal transduction histidine kinase
LQRHSETFATAAGIDIRYERPKALPPLSPAIEVACLRIVQEALHNVVRHSGAKRAFVTLRADVPARKLVLSVRDDGRDAGGPEGNGLGSIRDRAASLGGAATFSSSDRGSRWDVEIPLP